ncbi:hypothetical protein C8C96_2248 [Acidovorax sp. 100]|nr:hypothetical protein C8C96_2248 [Acidovorax sp. 100]
MPSLRGGPCLASLAWAAPNSKAPPKWCAAQRQCDHTDHNKNIPAASPAGV